VLVLGVGRATRLLGTLALTDKAYDATVRSAPRRSPTTPRAHVVEVRDASAVPDEAVLEGWQALDRPDLPGAVRRLGGQGRRRPRVRPRPRR
jgi:tRNA pseudouridine55 synthase